MEDYMGNPIAILLYFGVTYVATGFVMVGIYWVLYKIRILKEYQ